MKISSAENQFKYSKAMLEQNSSNAKLVCPQCKESTPSIEKIEMSLMKSPLVKFSCKCQNKNKEEIIDLEQYMYILLMENHSHKLCFKHPKAIASIYCQNCSLNMCNLCYSYHVSFEPTHRIIGIETEKNSSPCPYHLNTELDFFCDDCNMNICIHCAKKDHSKHQVMQLREYWERVNSKLVYKTNDTLNTFISKQINKYHFFIQNQFEKINGIIYNLQQIKAKLEKKSKRIQKANHSIGLFVSLIFDEFFKGKNTPNFQLIQNVEKITLENILVEESTNSVFKKYSRIDEEIKQLINDAKESSPSFIPMISKRTPFLKAFNINEFIEETNQQYSLDKSQDKINLSFWINEDYDQKKRNCILSHCSTNSTNEEKLNKIIQKEDILKSLNIFLGKEDKIKQPISNEMLDHNLKRFLNNKTYRNEDKEKDKNIISIPNHNYLCTKINNMPLYSSPCQLKVEKNARNLHFEKVNKIKNEKEMLNISLLKQNKTERLNEIKINNKEKAAQKISDDLIIDEEKVLEDIIEKENRDNKPSVSKAIQYDQCISTISQSSRVNAIFQLKTGHLISGGKDSVLRIYDNNSFDCISTIETNKNQIYCITELFDGSISVGLNDNSIKIYDSLSRTCMMILIGHSKPVTSIIQKDITTILSCSEDNTIKRWDLTTKKCLMTYDEHCNNVCGVIRINESVMISASKDSTLKLWNYASNRSLNTIRAHSSSISTIIRLFNNQLATASADKTIKFWEEKLQCCKGVLVGHNDQVSSIVQLIDGNLVSCSYDSSMKIWDLKTMTCINTIIVSSLKVYLLLQLFDGSIATVSEDSLIKIWV